MELSGNQAGSMTGTRAGAKLPTPLKAGVDLIRASGAWTRALAEGESTELALDWYPDELMDYGAADLRRFASEFDRSPGRWLCAPSRNGPHFSRQKVRRS
jgi:hypothetical protein